MNRMMRSGSLGRVMFGILDRNARGVGSNPAVGATFPIFITYHDIGAVTCILYKLHTICLLNLPYVYESGLPVCTLIDWWLLYAKSAA